MAELRTLSDNTFDRTLCERDSRKQVLAIQEDLFDAIRSLIHGTEICEDVFTRLFGDLGAER
ncbi:hypothetical protein BDW68DRAFT_155173 [Aspergillus falconensis]